MSRNRTIKDEFPFKKYYGSNHAWTYDSEEDIYECELCKEYEYVCEVHSEFAWDQELDTIEYIAELLKDRGWDFFSAGGYGGWNNSPSNSHIKEMTRDNLVSIFFCYQTEMTISIDNFDTVSKGYIEMRLSHHDRPMGETMYLVKEDDMDSEDSWEDPQLHAIEKVREINS
jgi:hypothetical protein